MHPPRPTCAAPAVLAATLATWCVAASGAALQAGQAPAALVDDALDLAYNLDHDEAMVRLRRAAALAPDDPAPHRSLASVAWLNILFRRGAVTVDYYLGAFTRPAVELPKPPPDMAAEFRSSVQRAIALAGRRVEARGSDPQAHYDLGAALGLEASYTASVEGRMLAGFRAARRSLHEHERVMDLDPARADAGLIVGTYRYVVSTLSLPMRTLAWIAGFGGGRQRGIELVERAAEDTRRREGSRADSRTEAMFALVLIYNRERRYDAAMRVLQRLRGMYPRNRLLRLEEGSTALRAGRPAIADEILTQGLRTLAADRRPRMPGEEALWHYKRGLARAALGRADAVADFERGASADSLPWVAGRSRVSMGRAALARGDRRMAAAEAREAESLCRRGRDAPCIEEARSLARSADGR